jgi:hypothetical protein
VLTLEQLMRVERWLRYTNASRSRQTPERKQQLDDVRALVAEVRRLWDEKHHQPPITDVDARIEAAITEFAAAIIGRKS